MEYRKLMFEGFGMVECGVKGHGYAALRLALSKAEAEWVDCDCHDTCEMLEEDIFRIRTKLEELGYTGESVVQQYVGYVLLYPGW